jgi:hypothetical protein
MKVWVEKPVVAGDTVHFQWRQSEPNRFQARNDFFIRYEDVDLSIFATPLFIEIFLALQLKVFAAYREPIDVIFSEPVPAPSIAYWTAFHRAERVAIGPISDMLVYQPLLRTPPRPERRRRAAVFFGGGKDSSVTAALLAEIYGNDQVALFQYIGPLRQDADLATRMELRQENLMLRPARENLGYATQKIWTDYQAIFMPDGYVARPHVELYTAGALPALIDRNVEVSSFGYARTDYPILPRPNGGRKYLYPMSRPEVLDTQTTHYQRTLGFNHTLTNLTFLFPNIVNFRLLHARYPAAFAQIVGCTQAGPTTPWCFKCGKCFLYAVYSLFTGAIDPKFDYETAFTQSGDARRWVAYAESGVEQTVYGNAPWRSDLMYPVVYTVLCHIFANIDVSLLKGCISTEAANNLHLFAALFGNHQFPNTHLLATEVADFLGGSLAHRAQAIAAEHFPVVERLPGPVLQGNTETIIDYRTRMSTPTALVPHIAQ